MILLQRTCLIAFCLQISQPGVAADAGFVSLFDGHSLQGWHMQCRAEDRPLATKFWSVQDKVIVADSIGHRNHENVWLVSDKEYGDFVFRLRFLVARDARGNSGVQIRSRYDTAAECMDGPQVDINPAGAWRTGMVWDETRGARGWLSPALGRGQALDPSLANPQMKFRYAEDSQPWNELEITAEGMKLKASLNGLVVMQYDGTGVLDDAVHRARQVGRSGQIALQIQRHDEVRVRFKELRIRELPGR